MNLDFRNPRDVARAAAGIHGWWSADSGRKLYDLILRSSGNVLELGAWCGRSTLWCAAALAARDPQGGFIVRSVDTWRGTPSEEVHREFIAALGHGQTVHQIWEKNLQDAGILDRCLDFVGTTAEAHAVLGSGAPGYESLSSYDVVVIDADHDYEAVRLDFAMFSEKLPSGAHVVLDDVPTWHGPTKFHVKLKKEPGWEFVEYWENQAVFRKV